MAKKRRRFTAEFKKRVALEALREHDTVQAMGLSEKTRLSGRDRFRNLHNLRVVHPHAPAH